MTSKGQSYRLSGLDRTCWQLSPPGVWFPILLRPHILPLTLAWRYCCSRDCISAFCCSRESFSISILALSVSTRLGVGQRKQVRQRPARSSILYGFEARPWVLLLWVEVEEELDIPPFSQASRDRQGDGD